ncbi:excalibur calcium-binding domain-containing protein [Pseudonocardia sp. GCM10023141]|uniref:excalibur calcium-binding domain-containing protein n=1 Tax=Pseudonocardia sp. GCM10023141 TaxID=3252653 RepID=UPI00361C5861
MTVSAVALCFAFTATAVTATAAAAPDVDCSDFTYQEEAQAVLDADPSDPNRLDGGSNGSGDGIACQSLPHLPTAVTTTPAQAAPVPVADAATPAEDRDCPDFATQADAQAALTAQAGDPERLDADGDGIACEDHFGTANQQVAVFPVGGVATGGYPAS